MPPIDLGPLLTFRVTHRKDLHHVTLPAAATVQQLHEKLEELTEVPFVAPWERRIILCRHGHVAREAADLQENAFYGGNFDVPLSAGGDADMRAVAEYIASQHYSEAAATVFASRKSDERFLRSGQQRCSGGLMFVWDRGTAEAVVGPRRASDAPRHGGAAARLAQSGVHPHPAAGGRCGRPEPSARFGFRAANSVEGVCGSAKDFRPA